MIAALHRFLFEENVYSIGIRRRKENLLVDGNTKDQFWILPISKDEWYADPMVFSHNGIDYLFCEVCNRNTKKGMIGYTVLGDKPTISRPQVVLEADYHLSYPCIFEKNGEVYMIPETTTHNSMELYHATEFPQKWEFIRELMSGDEFADTTILQQDGNSLLFTFQQFQGNGSIVKVRAYNASQLPKGELKEFAQGEDGFSNQYRGGGYFVELKDGWYRPTQDCSNYYGYALNFMKVEQWPSESVSYKEHLHRKILPFDLNVSMSVPKKIIGIHTYGLTKEYEIIDVKFNDVLFAHQLGRLWQYITRILRRIAG